MFTSSKLSEIGVCLRGEAMFVWDHLINSVGICRTTSEAVSQSYLDGLNPRGKKKILEKDREKDETQRK